MVASVPDRLAFEGFVTVASEAGGEVHGDRIYLPALDLTVSVAAVDAIEATNVLAVEVTAERPDLQPPIRFTAVGFGADFRASAVSAAEQWFEVVFPVVHSLYACHETANVGHGTIAARHLETGERFHWNITTGPVRVVVAGPSQPPAADDGKILRALSREITGVAVSTGPFWVDAYVAVQHDGNCVADCRLLNEPWPEAGERLREVAEDLFSSAGNDFVSWRQFMFFLPASAPATAATPKKKWWHFW